MHYLCWFSLNNRVNSNDCYSYSTSCNQFRSIHTRELKIMHNPLWLESLEVWNSIKRANYLNEQNCNFWGVNIPLQSLKMKWHKKLLPSGRWTSVPCSSQTVYRIWQLLWDFRLPTNNFSIQRSVIQDWSGGLCLDSPLYVRGVTPVPTQS